MTTSRWARWPAQRRHAALGLAVVTALATVAVPSAAAGKPDQTAGTAVPPAGTTTVSSDGLRATITLITGDKVSYTETPDGRTTATLSSVRPGTTPVYDSYGDESGFYVIPRSATSLVNTGVLDRGLFDVKYLAHNGYADDESTTIPVITSYQSNAARSAAAGGLGLAGASGRIDLPSVSGEGLTVDKDRAAAFWSTVTTGTTPGARTHTVVPAPANGLRRMWLDRKVEVNLDESVAMVGAPEAWAAGFDGSGVKVAVLDTGIDVNHPDLKGKVVGSQSFVPGASALVDGHGHGTHVASTIAGTGAASGGRYKGVAPGAQLLVGKVLSDQGQGNMSWAIDAMEWAATNGARVVSMSLGAQATDGTDPASQAVNRLTATTGALFVIAAGNDGPGKNTVASPGTADAALTVAAVTKDDQLASFSSRGPRTTDRALKPDISAPGVDIVAARASGTSMGRPVDERYTAANGTSMATPHVAGAAAIIAQQHKDWTASQLKPTLMSTAKDDGFTAYEQGAGRLDVARAVRQPVHSTTPNLDFRNGSPNDKPKTSKEISYTNPTGQPVTLKLTSNLRRVGGQAAPGDALTADPSVSVPAGGTATVTVTADLTVLEDGTYTGSVVATDDGTGTRLTTPVGLVRQPPLRTIDIRIVGRPGEPLAQGSKSCWFQQLDDNGDGDSYLVALSRSWDGPNVTAGSARIPEGRYSLECDDSWTAKNSIAANVALFDPEVTITRDTVFKWDLATDVVPINDVVTPLPTETVMHMMGHTRTAASGRTSYSATIAGSAYGMKFYVSPTSKRVTVGTYKFFFEQLRAAPEAVTTVQGRGSVQVRPIYLADYDFVPKFATDQRLRLMTEADLRAGRDVRGKLVVIESDPWVAIDEEVDLATRAGAAGVLNHVVGDSPVGSGSTPFLDTAAVKIPVLWLDGAQWSKVAKVLQGASRPSVTIRSQLVSPYEYKLRFYENGRIPRKFDYRVSSRTLAVRQTEYHAQFAPVPLQPNAYEVNHTFAPEDKFSINYAHHFDAPTSRTEYYSVTGRDIRWSRDYVVYNRNDEAAPERSIQTVNGFSIPSSESETINQGPTVLGTVTPGAEWKPNMVASLCMVCREGDDLYVYLGGTVPVNDPEKWVVSDGSVSYSLKRDGVEIPPAAGGVDLPHYALGADPATYTLHTAYEDQYSGQKYGKKINTDWTFGSRRVEAGNVGIPYQCPSTYLGSKGACGWQPLIQLNYDLDLALDDTARAGRPYAFTVTPQQPQPTGAPAIAGLKLSVSYDDGAHWTPARVSRGRDGVYRVQVTHPSLSRTTGAVSIQAEAWDTAGNRVVQQIDRAYGLSAGSPSHR
ncbi:S8 family serine peptidase [Micromonospora sp. NPDC005413]|uniref:S8 family serine peptidase n=1 Tax=Micromonospora sp. NPDC005413 TaxID=3154563 RepID=UPI0033B0DEED